ncbi:MAG: hypothetical protein J6M35_06850 [Clostridia bacterium]|nr:hypothetical protein [Clostridia bacterium]
MTAWRQYESGKDHKRQIGLYRRVDENERFFRGDQWHGIASEGLPTPVFNIIKRITAYLISAILYYKLSVNYLNRSLPYSDPSPRKKKVSDMLDLLNKMHAYRWDVENLDNILREGLTDAALSGNGIFYSYWDESVAGGNGYVGDIRTETVDSTNVFVADVNSEDIQRQDYIILSGRTSVYKLRAEAIANGRPADLIEKIVPDDDLESLAGDYASYENNDLDSEKATYLIKFTKDENGFVSWEKSVKHVIISSCKTQMKLYPIVSFVWDKVKNSFFGSSPITELIQNQKYVNKAYAMMMKHMIDTAFSKVIYDKRLIPEWSNEVGEAIGVMSGGDVSNVVSTVGVGEMQDNFIEIIESVISHTKRLSGANDTVLGETDPTNTSAILALREASEVSLDTVRTYFITAVKELALVRFELLREYWAPERPIIISNSGDDKCTSIDFRIFDGELIDARVDTGASRRFSQSLLTNTLEWLLKSGHITFEEYLERIPDGIITRKEELLDRARADSERIKATYFNENTTEKEISKE